jgi:DNA-directed RNA polymerase subunit M/transcription elongation factor TFIIS
LLYFFREPNTVTALPLRVEASCGRCGFVERLDMLELVARLRRLGMLKRGDDLEPQFLLEIAAAARERLTCSSCGRGGVLVQLADERDEFEPASRPCAACGAAIPAERLELFPDSELCASCQQRIDRGQTPDQHDDYCPRCGTRMVVRQRRGSGIAGYEMSCPACRRR